KVNSKKVRGLLGDTSQSCLRSFLSGESLGMFSWASNTLLYVVFFSLFFLHLRSDFLSLMSAGL
uniref:Uncharacterized protein n=1 Tax=Amphiprion percula TaxID=161767 RepID=A0A3P8TMN4_AMPPE